MLREYERIERQLIGTTLSIGAAIEIRHNDKLLNQGGANQKGLLNYTIYPVPEASEFVNIRLLIQPATNRTGKR
jgi:hypothetical protein